MNVLHVGKYFHPARGGIERVLYNLATGLRDRCRVEVLVFNTVGETVTDQVEGVPVTRLAKWEKLFSQPFSPAMFWWLRHRRYDIVHVHCPNPLAVMSYLLTRPTGLLVVSYHSDIVKQRWLHWLYGVFQRRFLARAEAIIVATPAHVTSSKVLMRLHRRVDVIPYGIDVDLYDGNGPVAARAEELARDLGSSFVLFTGRLVYYKGVHHLLAAMEGLPARLVLAGDGPYYANLRLLAERLRPDQVVFLGEVDDVTLRALYRLCAVFVLPSVSPSEAFGIVQLEAMASGKPVVSTRLSTGVPLVNRDGETGLVVEPGDVGQLRDAIRRLLEDEDLRRQLGGRGQARVRAEYTRALMCDRTLAVYERLLQTSASATSARGGAP